MGGTWNELHPALRLGKTERRTRREEREEEDGRMREKQDVRRDSSPVSDSGRGDARFISSVERKQLANAVDFVILRHPFLPLHPLPDEWNGIRFGSGLNTGNVTGNRYVMLAIPWERRRPDPTSTRVP